MSQRTSKLFRTLNGPVGNGLANNEDDVQTTQKNLRQAGYFEGEENGILSRTLDTSIRTYQTDQNLKIDGKLYPRGETENSLFSTLGLNDQVIKKNNTDTEESIGFGQGTSGVLAPRANQNPPTPKAFQLAQSEDTPDAIFKEWRERLRPREGGVANRSFSADPGGVTNKGMSQNLLEQLRKAKPEIAMPDKTTSMSDETITEVFHNEFYKQPKIDKLVRIQGLQQSEPRLAEHVFDAGLMSGPREAGIWLQQALDTVIESDLKDGQSGYDGNIGPRTRAAVKDAVKRDQIRKVHENFTKRRLEYLKSLSNYPLNPGWPVRVQEFLDPPSKKR